MLGLEIVGVVLLVIGWVCLICWMMTKTIDASDLEAWVWGIGATLVFAFPFAIGIPLITVQDAKPFDGYVYKKSYTPAYTSVMSAGKTLVPVYHPPRWNMVLKSQDDERSCDIPEEMYDQLELGSEQHCGGY